MTQSRTEPLDERQLASMRLPDLLQVLTLTRPHLATAVEVLIRALLVDDARQAMVARLERCTSADLEVMDTLLKQFERVRDLERERGALPSAP